MTAYGQSGLLHLTVWPSLPDCFTSNKRLVAHVWPSVTPKFSTAGGLDLQRRETVKYANQTFTSFNIIVWIHNVLLCKMILCCSLIRGFTSLTSRMATNTLFPKGLKSLGLNPTSVSVSNGFASLRYTSVFIRAQIRPHCLKLFLCFSSALACMWPYFSALTTQSFFIPHCFLSRVISFLFLFFVKSTLFLPSAQVSPQFIHCSDFGCSFFKKVIFLEEGSHFLITLSIY